MALELWMKSPTSVNRGTFWMPNQHYHYWPRGECWNWLQMLHGGNPRTTRLVNLKNVFEMGQLTSSHFIQLRKPRVILIHAEFATSSWHYHQKIISTVSNSYIDLHWLSGICWQGIHLNVELMSKRTQLNGRMEMENLLLIMLNTS
jgi:hypothetical protein